MERLLLFRSGFPGLENAASRVAGNRFEAAGLILKNNQRVLGPFQSAAFFGKDPDEVFPSRGFGVGAVGVGIMDKDKPSP